MAIVPRGDAPADGPQEIGRALEDLSIVGRNDPLEGGASIDIASPIAVYRLGMREIDAGFPRGLTDAAMVGWRYLMLGAGGAGVSFADVSEAQGSPKLTSIARNSNAEALLEATRIAEAAVAELEGECEVRVLEIPVARMSAIWIVLPEAKFVPFIDGAHGEPAKLKIFDGPAFFSELKLRL